MTTKTRTATRAKPTTRISALAKRKQTELDTACSAYQALGAEIAELRKVQQELKPGINDLAKELGVEKRVGDGWQLIRTTSRTSKITPEALLSLGVDFEVIEAATEVTERTYYQVRTATNEEKR